MKNENLDESTLFVVLLSRLAVTSMFIVYYERHY